MLRRLLSFIKFLIFSTNQYGVHSPFVYSYLTQCLYKKLDLKLSKSRAILFKSIPYFEIRSVSLHPEDIDLKTILMANFPLLKYNTGTDEISYLDCSKINLSLVAIEEKTKIHDIIILDHIRNTNETFKAWEKLCQKPWVSVSIDFYFGGILFLYKTQEKQHFRIRV